MRTWIALMLLTLAAPCRSEPPVLAEETVVAYAKTIDVAELDESLPSQPLEEWLRAGRPRLQTLEWRMNHCDLKPEGSERPQGYPVCARIAFRRGAVGGWMLVRVGTTRRGIVEPPSFVYANVAVKAGDGYDHGRTEKLSDLPALIEQRLPEKP